MDRGWEWIAKGGGHVGDDFWRLLNIPVEFRGPMDKSSGSGGDLFGSPLVAPVEIWGRRPRGVTCFSWGDWWLGDWEMERQLGWVVGSFGSFRGPTIEKYWKVDPPNDSGDLSRVPLRSWGGPSGQWGWRDWRVWGALSQASGIHRTNRRFLCVIL